MAVKKSKAISKTAISKTSKKIPVPVGVKVISVVYWITSALMIIGGISLIVGKELLIEINPILTAYTSLLTLMAFIIIAIGILEIFIGIGLWKRKSWARITAIILSIIGILAALVGMANKDILNNILGLVINGAIAVYLLFSYNVKKAFY
ncbi:DUF2127 domain-containing protein [Candidatus Pacearchaeota archaeon]|nr:DUF2127 domain-containing protein [Candidatus Pacearchaeota archaeon]